MNPSFFIENNILTKYTGHDTDIIIPFGVEAVGPSAFAGNRELKSIVFPTSLTEIGEAAFKGCNSLETIQLNQGLLRIEKKAFFACRMNTVILPDSLQFIGESAFTEPPNSDLIFHCNANSAADKYAKEYGIKTVISKHAPLRDINGYGKTLLYAYQADFTSDQKTVFIPEGTETIFGAFAHDLMIERVVLPSTLTHIHNATFSNCYNLREINFPDSLVFIGDLAFEHCAIEEAVLPDSLKSIGKGAFHCCRLQRVRLSSSILSIPEKAFMSTEIDELIFPVELKEIGDYAFAYLRKNARFKLPAGLERIGKCAFANNTFLNIRIPCEATSFSSKAFEHNRGTVIYVKNAPDSFTPDAFGKESGTIIITESQVLKERFADSKGIAVVEAPYAEDYDYVQHLKKRETVPVEFLPLGFPAYQMLKEYHFDSINQLLDLPESRIPDETFIGRHLKPQVLDALKKVRTDLSNQIL